MENDQIGIIRYVLVMLLFFLPVLIVGYYMVRENTEMLMPLMFVLVFGAITIKNRLTDT